MAHESLTINSRTPESMRYLRTASIIEEITPFKGIWRLWKKAKPVKRAKVLIKPLKDAKVTKITDKNRDEIRRIQQNVDNALDERQSGDEDDEKMDETLDEKIKLGKSGNKGRPIGS